MDRPKKKKSGRRREQRRSQRHWNRLEIESKGEGYELSEKVICTCTRRDC